MMDDEGPSGEERAKQAVEELRRTLSLLEEADHEAAKFRRYLHDNHWADKARRLWNARTL